VSQQALYGQRAEFILKYITVAMLTAVLSPTVLIPWLFEFPYKRTIKAYWISIKILKTLPTQNKQELFTYFNLFSESTFNFELQTEHSDNL
jgi:hypothetical protein